MWNGIEINEKNFSRTEEWMCVQNCPDLNESKIIGKYQLWRQFSLSFFKIYLSLCAGFIFPSYANDVEERDSQFENQTSELTLPNSHYYLGWYLIYNFRMICFKLSLKTLSLKTFWLYLTRNILDLSRPGGADLPQSVFLFSWTPGGSDLLKNGLI